MSYGQILYNAQDGIATITLNRPEKLNAWTNVLEQEVRHAMTEATADAAVRVIILTGAGRGFCAGADMSLLNAVQERSETASATERPVAFPGPISGRARSAPGVLLSLCVFPHRPEAHHRGHQRSGRRLGADPLPVRRPPLCVGYGRLHHGLLAARAHCRTRG